jgi:hypothetical protein
MLKLGDALRESRAADVRLNQLAASVEGDVESFDVGSAAGPAPGLPVRQVLLGRTGDARERTEGEVTLIPQATDHVAER